MTVDYRRAALRKHYIAGFQVLSGALDQLLERPEPYFDPEILPDPHLPDDFCTRHRALRDGVVRDLSDIVKLPALARNFEVTRGAGLPIQGCLMRRDMELMRSDVKECLAALRSL